jgi:elongation factor G
MQSYVIDQIRNISLVGHRGSGKTMLSEALLCTAGVLPKIGSIESGTTTSDFDKEEKKREFSINTSIIPLEYLGHKYNILDTPGYFDFKGEVLSALRVSGGAVLVMDASSDVEVGAEKAWKMIQAAGIPSIIFINKMDKGIGNYEKLLNEMKEKFGKKIAPFCVPIVENEEFKGFINVADMVGRRLVGDVCVDCEIPEGIDISEVRDHLLEAVAETDEELMARYFEGDEFTHDEIVNGLHKGVLNGEIVPVIIGSALTGVGIHTLFKFLFDYLPNPMELVDGMREGINPETGDVEIRKRDINEPFSALVFKTLVDPFIGKITIFKVESGILKRDMEVLNSSRDKKERISNIFLLRGNKQLEADEIRAGDIGAITKLAYTQTGDTLCDKDAPIRYETIDFPKPTIYFAIEPLDKSDDEKISTSLQRLIEEDPTFKIERNFETKELLIGGQGDKHLQIVTSKLENKFGVKSKVSNPKISYRETIKKPVSVQGKHKKQSGGAGQYGDVFIKFEPTNLEFEFIDDIHGGVVPKSYIPAVEKGLVEAKQKGVLAGYPVINLKATLYDGSYHPVDSNEISFKQAAILAFRKGIQDASPIILEPIMRMEITVPETDTGDVMGDINKRRGRVLGIDFLRDGEQKITVEVPQAEILKYSLDLRAMTQGRGEFEFAFARYEEVPEHLVNRIIEESPLR